MSEHLEKLLEETASLRAPLEGAAPAGIDLSLEPEFEPIKNEIEKLTSLEGGSVDWGGVVRGAEELLAGRTKDLRLAVWMTVGAGHTRGWRGLARGLAVVRSLVIDMWEPVLPTRAKARSNIVGWLAERATPVLQELAVKLEDGDDVRTIAALVADIDREMADKLGDAFGGIRPLVNASRNRVNDIPVPPPPKAPTPPPPPPPSEPPPQARAASVAPAAPPPPRAGAVALSGSAADADATTRTITDALVTLARSIKMVEPARAWAYSMHRKAIWLRVEGVPTELGPAPDPAMRERLAMLVSESRWVELVFAGEEASARWPLWLDPHRFVALALERLGSAFNEAREVVGRETSELARRHGARLAEARFEDGTSPASIETTSWLEAETRRFLRATEADVGRDEDRELAHRFADARHLVAAGQHAEGLAIAMQLARRAADPRDRFRASLDVARLAAEAGAYDVARPILDALAVQAETHALATWEPALAARLYAARCRCLPADSPERAEAFEILCRIDPGRALRVQGRGRIAAPVFVAAPAPPPMPVPVVAPMGGGTNGVIGTAIAAIASAFTPAVEAGPAPVSAPVAPSTTGATSAAGAEEAQWADDWD